MEKKNIYMVNSLSALYASSKPKAKSNWLCIIKFFCLYLMSYRHYNIPHHAALALTLFWTCTLIPYMTP